MESCHKFERFFLVLVVIFDGQVHIIHSFDRLPAGARFCAVTPSLQAGMQQVPGPARSRLQFRRQVIVRVCEQQCV